MHVAHRQKTILFNMIFSYFSLTGVPWKVGQLSSARDAMQRNVRVSSEVLPTESGTQEVCMKTHRRTRADMSLAAQRPTSTQLAESKKGSIKLAFTEKGRLQRRGV